MWLDVACYGGCGYLNQHKNKYNNHLSFQLIIKTLGQELDKHRFIC